MQRLKLYDTTISLSINSKLKKEIKRIAYKQKMTMSEYIRRLIKVNVDYNKELELKEKINTIWKG